MAGTDTYRVVLSSPSRVFFSHSIELSGGGYPSSSKAFRGKDLEIEQPVACRDGATFDFHPTLAGVLGTTLVLAPQVFFR